MASRSWLVVTAQLITSKFSPPWQDLPHLFQGFALHVVVDGAAGEETVIRLVKGPPASPTI